MTIKDIENDLVEDRDSAPAIPHLVRFAVAGAHSFELFA